MADIQLYPKERRVVMATAIFAGICLAIAYGAEWGRGDLFLSVPAGKCDFEAGAG